MPSIFVNKIASQMLRCDFCYSLCTWSVLKIFSKWWNTSYKL